LAEKYKAMEPSLSNASAGGIGAGVTILIGLLVLARESYFLSPIHETGCGLISCSPASHASDWLDLVWQTKTLRNLGSIPSHRSQLFQRFSRIRLLVSRCLIIGWMKVERIVMLKYYRKSLLQSQSVSSFVLLAEVRSQRHRRHARPSNRDG
jgi:hypothetical protein